MTKVATFYKFVALPDCEERRLRYLAFGRERNIKGTILLAEEGINATVAGPPDAIDALLQELRSDALLSDLSAKFSHTENMPFYRLKVKIKPEIVTLRVPGLDPAKRTGTHVDAEAWNQLIQRDDVRIIDTRNDFEVAIGSFEGAENPNTENFTDFPDYVDQHLDPERDEHVAMFCTGGIRCEKASALLLERGFKHVYQLNGGILQYLEDVEPDTSLWNGECFVFDQRVTVNPHLQPGSYDLCHGCWQPVNDTDRTSEHYLPGVACPRCYSNLDPAKRRSAEERVKQIRLARERNEEHLGRELPTSRGSNPS